MFYFQLISLFPRLLPRSTNFVRSVPPLHDLADINSITKNDSEMNEKMQCFLAELLEFQRMAAVGEPLAHKQVNIYRNFEFFSLKIAVFFFQEIDTAMIKLYSKDNAKLLEYLRLTDLEFEMEDCQTILETHARHNALAILRYKSGQYDASLKIWSDLLAGNLTDESFQGLGFFIQKLLR